MKHKGSMFDPLRILKALYKEVYDIASYVNMLQTEYSCNIAMFQDGDPKTFGTFLSHLLVCIQKDGKPLHSHPSFVQFSSQREIVARVIQRICEKKKRNVLSFGYGLIDENSLSHVKYASNICNFSPNQTTATVSTSILWETLLTRLGDDVMMHLLENCSLFVMVPPSCCYQVSGQPIYNLSKDDKCFPLRIKQRYPMTLNNIFHEVRRKALNFRNKFFKRNCWKTKLLNKYKDLKKGRVIHKNQQTHPNKTNSLEMTTQRRQTKRQRMDTCPVSNKRMKILHNENTMNSLFVKQDLKTEALNEEYLPHLKTDSFDGCSNFPIAVMQESYQQEPGKKLNDCNVIKKCSGGNGDKDVPSQVQSLKPVSTPESKVSLSKILIDFSTLLYCSKVYKGGFPDTFLLNKLERTSSGIQKLIQAIFISSNLFKSCYDHQYPDERSLKKLPKRYWQIRDVFRELIENHKKCPYMALLNKHCPRFTSVFSHQKKDLTVKAFSEFGTKQSYSNTMANTIPFTSKQDFNNELMESGNFTSVSQRTITETCESLYEPLKETKIIKDEFCLLTLLKQHSSVWQVYMFVRVCLQKVVPGTLWGSSRNKRCFLRNVKNLIYSVKYDKISLSELMRKIRVEDCSWIRLKSTRFVSVSEHVLREQNLSKFIYWLMNTYVAQLLKSFFYITETLFQKNKLFFFRKELWKRIQNIGLRKHFENVQLRLMSSQEMQDLEQQNSDYFISSLRFVPKSSGLRPIAKLCCMLGAQPSNECRNKKIQHFNSRVRNLFSVLNYERSKKSEIVGASVFGLDDIYKRWKKFVLEFQESKDKVKFYFVKADVKSAYDTIPHSKLKEVVSKLIQRSTEEHYCIRRYATVWMDSAGKMRKLFKQHVSTMNDFFPGINEFASHLQDCSIMRNTILVEQSLSLNENSEDLLSFLEQLICSHILRINNKILMRFTDDFLLVTPHLEHAKLFLRMLTKGIPQYGCSLSPHKTAVNFPVDDVPEFSEVKTYPAHCLFPWCGLLFDTQTLEVYCDYSSYARTSIHSSLTFCHSNSAGNNMREKLIRILKLKCHHLFLDLKVNSQRTVYINVYKIFLLQAYRFHVCVLQLPFHQGIRSNPAFFLNVISEMAPCLYTLLKICNKDLTIGFKVASGSIPFEAVQWLSYHAFTTKLTVHKATYKCLLGPLKRCEAWLSGKLLHEKVHLLRAVTNGSLHKDFSTVLS
uniref:Telomerase reverse transcriptase n=1 Tax=Leptobrachium leishanense TaxID=445787 RepID=A0A8C5QU59_9ANUR